MDAMSSQSRTNWVFPERECLSSTWVHRFSGFEYKIVLFAVSWQRKGLFMKTPKDFDYDLWTTEDGKNMVRIKATGEVTEVNSKVMRLLRAEEKRHRREMEGVPISGSKTEKTTLLSLDILSLDNFSENENCPSWLVDNASNPELIVPLIILKRELVERLSSVQRDVYQKCICEGLSLREYARQRDINAAVEASREYRRNF